MRQAGASPSPKGHAVQGAFPEILGEHLDHQGGVGVPPRPVKVAHAVDHHLPGPGAGAHHEAAGTHAEGVYAPAPGLPGQLVVRRPQLGVAGEGTVLAFVDKILGMLRRLQAVKPVWLELGLQTVHEETARRILRGYELPVFEESYYRLKREGFPVIVHLIFSLPGESREDMLESVRYLAALDPPPDGVKLQMLHVLRGTELGEEYLRQPFPLLSLEDYAELIAESAAILPEETVFHRVTGDGPGKLLIAPDWTRNKKRVLNTINARLREQGE